MLHWLSLLNILSQRRTFHLRDTFRRAVQKPHESIDAYVTRLGSLAKSCEYDKVDEMIGDQVVDKCASNSLPRRLLRAI